jgi:hypothetical protein
MNETGRRKNWAFELPARNVMATIAKIPKAARNSPIPAVILLKLRLRLAKIRVLFGVVRVLHSFFGVGCFE